MADSRIILEVVASGKNIKIVQKDVENLSRASTRASRGVDDLDKSAKIADRNLKGLSRQSSNTTKNFSKMQQGMTGLVPAYAILASNVFAVSAAFQFFSKSFDFANIIRGQEALGSVTGVAYKSITNALVEATEGQLKYAEAARAAAIGTAAGLTSGQLERLSASAKNASLALGRDLTDSFNRLIRGVTKAEPELLDELGIILRLDPALTKYATSIGKTKSQLNAFERTQAVTNEVLEQAEEKYAAIAAKIDPSVFALQRFAKSFDELLNVVKVNIAGALAPILEFLTKNTYALTAALALFALPILKTILPNLKEWKEQSKIQGDVASAALKKQKADIEALIVARKRLKAESIDPKAGLQDLLKGAKLGTLAKGKGVSQLIAGEKPDTKILKQLLDAAEKNKGVINKLQQDQRASYKAMLQAMIADTAGATNKIKQFWKGVVTSSQLQFKRIQALYSVAMRGIITITTATVTAINFALAAIGWIGILLLIYQVGKEVVGFIKNKLFPMSDAEKKAEEATRKLTDRMTTLNEELERAAEVRADKALLSLGGIVESVGNSLQSIDVGRFARDFNDFDRSNADLRAEFAKTAKILSDIDPKFAIFNNALRDGRDLTDKEAQSVAALAQEYIKAGTSLQRLNELNRQRDQDISNLIGGIPKQPADELIRTLTTLVDETTITFDAKLREFEKALGSSLDASIIQEYIAEIGNMGEALKIAKLQLDAFSKIRSSLLATDKQIADNSLRAAKLANTGLSFEGQRLNIAAEQLKNENSILQARKELLTASTFLETLENASSEATKEQRENARASYEIALQNLAITQEENRLQNDKNALALQKIALEERLLSLQKSAFEISSETFVAEQQLAKLRAGLTNFGLDQGIAERLAEERVLTLKLEEAYSSLFETQVKLNAVPQGDVVGLQNAREAERIAKQRVEQARQELEVNKRREEIFINELILEGRLLQLRKSNLSINPIQQAFNDKVGEALARGVVLSDQQLKILADQVQVQYELNEAIKLQEGIQNSIAENLTSGITSLIDGTKSLKEAFADTAIAILRDLASMLARMLAMRALMAVFKTDFKVDVGFDTSGLATELAELQANIKISLDERIIQAFNYGATQISGSLNSGANGLATAIDTSFSSATTNMVASLDTSLAKGAAVLAEAAKPTTIISNTVMNGEGSQLPQMSTPTALGTSIVEEKLVEIIRVLNIISGAFTELNTKLPLIITEASNKQIMAIESCCAALRVEETETAPRIIPGTVAPSGEFVGPPEKSKIFGSFIDSIKNVFSEDNPFLGRLFSIFKNASSSFLSIFTNILGGSSSFSGILSSVIPMLFGNGGIAYGGVRAMATGGVITQPTMAMIGEGRYNEAVVPLPDGKSIPVNVMGGGAQTNNVTVNVSIDGNGNARQQITGDQAGNLGNIIARAVQQELQNQKRSGGILNPYGAA